MSPQVKLPSHGQAIAATGVAGSGHWAQKHDLAGVERDNDTIDAKSSLRGALPSGLSCGRKEPVLAARELSALVVATWPGVIAGPAAGWVTRQPRQLGSIIPAVLSGQVPYLGLRHDVHRKPQRSVSHRRHPNRRDVIPGPRESSC